MKIRYCMLIISMLFLLNGCVKTFTSGVQNALTSIANSVANIKPDTSMILLSSEVKNTKKVIGKAEIVFKNLDNGNEETLELEFSDYTYKLKKLKPGKYKITKWSLDTCEIAYPSGYCKDWHNFEGKSAKLDGNTFTIKKGDILYLGHAIVNPINQTLTFVDNYNLDVVKYRHDVYAFKNREIKDISYKLNIHNWKFRITDINVLKGLFN